MSSTVSDPDVDTASLPVATIYSRVLERNPPPDLVLEGEGCQGQPFITIGTVLKLVRTTNQGRLPFADHGPLGVDIEAHSYSGNRAAEIVGITYRQLDYWARTDLVRPTVVDAAGSGSRRRYGYADLLELRVVKSLLDAGLRLEMVRDVFSYLRESLGEDIATANLVIQGRQTVVIRKDEDLIELVKSGQGMLNILPMAGVKGELDARIIELFPADGGVEAQDGPTSALTAIGD